METQIWQHLPSGDTFAVALWSWGAIKGACGPLSHQELGPALQGDWESDWEVVGQIEADQESYLDITDRVRG